MSNRLFQGIIHQMRDTIDRTIGVVDESSVIIACSELGKIGEVCEEITPEEMASVDVFQTDEYSFKSFGSRPRPEYAVFVAGKDPEAPKYVKILAVSPNSIKQYYDEKYDRSNFIKNVILDNILPGDIYLKSRELRFNADVSRVCMLIKVTSKTDVSAYDVVQNLFPDRQRDFVLSVTETDIVVIRELTGDAGHDDVYGVASQIEQAIKNELGVKTVIGIGGTAYHLRELADRYQEAQVAIEVGKVFDTEKTIISYENLGIGRIIYQLPTTLCEMFLSEVFKKNPIETLDEDTLETINKFFENNLNVSETSRKLYVHRNTLVYRLEKIKKLTGLDLREFDHAIVFKVAMMVKKYLDSQNSARF